MRATAATALSEAVSGNVSNQDAVRAAGGVTALVGLLGRGSASDVREMAARELSSLASGNAHNQAAIRASGGREALSALLSAGAHSLSDERDDPRCDCAAFCRTLTHADARLFARVTPLCGGAAAA